MDARWSQGPGIPVVAIPIAPILGLGEGTAVSRPRTQGLGFVAGMPGPFSDAKGMAPHTRVPLPAFDPPNNPNGAAPWEKHDPKWGAGGVSRKVTHETPPNTGPPRAQPAWLKFSAITLHFGGYFEDLEVTKRTGELRVRRCVMTYHLEDGSVDIREPRSENSGLEQARILHRMRVPNQHGAGGVMTPGDFNVGCSPIIFKREYHVLACDAFTRAFLEREGFVVPNELPFPTERDPKPPKGQFPSAPSLAKAPEQSSIFSLNSMNLDLPTLHDQTKPVPGSLSAAADELKQSAGRQFLSLDGNVLRFFCTSDGESSVKKGDDQRTDGKPKVPFTLHYFLADDTVEVLEVLPVGVDEYSRVLRRQKLPKPSSISQGGFGVGVRPASQDTIKRGGAFGNVRWRDLRIGGSVNVFGKMLTLRDCDQHTRDWYKQELGFGDDRFVALPAPTGPILKQRAPPPLNTSGIGSDKDSLQYCLRLVPKPQPTTDFNSWQLHSGHVLRFTATFVNTATRLIDDIDKTRTFVVSFFMEDNTVAAFEPPVANSGLPGGPFFKRNPAKKTPGAYYVPSDFTVGSVVFVSGRAFRLNGADDSTFILMESRPSDFPKSDFASVVAATKSLLTTRGRESRDALRKASALEDMKIGGGGAMVLTRQGFIEVMTNADAHLQNVCAQSLVTLWRGLPKQKIDTTKTRAPEAFKSGPQKDLLHQEFVDVSDLFELLGVPWVEESLTA